MVNRRELANRSPREALWAGIGMVYQHFTLVPGVTVAENLLLARPQIPIAVRWSELRRELEDRLAKAPFRVPLDAECASLSRTPPQRATWRRRRCGRPLGRRDLAWTSWS